MYSTRKIFADEIAVVEQDSRGTNEARDMVELQQNTLLAISLIPLIDFFVDVNAAVPMCNP